MARTFVLSVDLTDEEKQRLDEKRKSNGQTLKGVLRMLILSYLREGAGNGNTEH